MAEHAQVRRPSGKPTANHWAGVVAGRRSPPGGGTVAHLRAASLSTYLRMKILVTITHNHSQGSVNMSMVHLGHVGSDFYLRCLG